MSAYAEYRKIIKGWRDGKSTCTDARLLDASKQYLDASNDWPMVRDILCETGMTQKEILGWFGKQDCPDFREAVNEGWGWGQWAAYG